MGNNSERAEAVERVVEAIRALPDDEWLVIQGDTITTLNKPIRTQDAKTFLADYERRIEALEFYADEAEILWEPCEDNKEHGLFRYAITSTRTPWMVAWDALGWTDDPTKQNHGIESEAMNVKAEPTEAERSTLADS